MRYVGGAVGHDTTRSASIWMGTRSANYAKDFVSRREQERADFEMKNPEAIFKKPTDTVEEDLDAYDDEDSGPDAGACDEEDEYDRDFDPDADDYEPESDDEFGYRWCHREGVADEVSDSDDERAQDALGAEDGQDGDVEEEDLGYDDD